MTLVAAKMSLSEKKVSDAVNERTVEVFFQKSPGWPTANERGIQKMKYKVLADEDTIQEGETDNQGKSTVRVRAGSTTILRIAESNYTVEIQQSGYKAKTDNIGLQQRLRTLGYQLGDNLDGKINKATDRAVLQFQADYGMDMKGTIDATLQNKLDTEAKK